ncbi:class I SAM-dependent methyltransferase [Candidatus Bipolaricaulota bacterium]
MDDRQETEAVHLDSTQEQLFGALRARGIAGRSILEIGCGTGGLLHRLLEEGARSAVGVELSEQYLVKARARASRLGHEGRVVYLKGDFMEISDQIEPADVTILDKVVHCYHDPRTLIRRSTAHTRTLYAVSFLRSRWVLRVCLLLLGPFARLFLPFRVRFSRPEVVRAWIREEGFERIFQTEGETFYAEVYRRRENFAADLSILEDKE